MEIETGLKDGAGIVTVTDESGRSITVSAAPDGYGGVSVVLRGEVRSPDVPGMKVSVNRQGRANYFDVVG